jgi:hypothetical protein
MRSSTPIFPHHPQPISLYPGLKRFKKISSLGDGCKRIGLWHVYRIGIEQKNLERSPTYGIYDCYSTKVRNSISG